MKLDATDFDFDDMFDEEAVDSGEIEGTDADVGASTEADLVDDAFMSDAEDLVDSGGSEEVIPDGDDLIDSDGMEESYEIDSGISMSPDEDLVDTEPEEPVEEVKKPKKEKRSKGKKVKEAKARKGTKDAKSTKGTKEARPKKPKKEKKPRKPLSLRTKLILGGVGVLLIGIIVFNVMRDKKNYYSAWDTILSQETGTFNFILDVRTSKDEGGDLQLGSVSFDEAKNAEGVGSEEGTSSGDTEVATGGAVTGGTQTAEWSTADGAVNSDWTYPRYRLSIDGMCIGTEPYVGKWEVRLTTDAYDDILTTVTVVDGKFYMNVQQLQNWLRNSKDSYLVKLASDIPENSRFLVLEDKDLKFVSGYAEEDEQDAGYCNNFRTFVNEHKYIINAVFKAMKNASDGYMSKKDDIYMLNISDNSFVNRMKSAVAYRDNWYTSLVGGLQNEGIVDGEQYEQLLREKDNFLSASTKLYNAITSQEVQDFKCQGSSRFYTSSMEKNVIESSLSMAFRADGTNYNISFGGKLEGYGEEIIAPSVPDSYVEQAPVWSVGRNILQYLNITGVDLHQRLDLDVSTIQANIIDDFVTYINKEAKTKINSLSAKDFIKKYMNYKETAGSSEEDKKCAQMVQDFLMIVRDLSGGTVQVSTQSTNISQFLTVNKSVGNVMVVAEYKQDASDGNLGVIHVTMLNKGSSDVDMNLTDFCLQTLVKSRYPANSEQLIEAENSNFDTSKLKSTVTVPSGGYVDEDIYIVHSNGLEYMDLCYGESVLGTMIARK